MSNKSKAKKRKRGGTSECESGSYNGGSLLFAQSLWQQTAAAGPTTSPSPSTSSTSVLLTSSSSSTIATIRSSSSLSALDKLQNPTTNENEISKKINDDIGITSQQTTEKHIPSPSMSYAMLFDQGVGSVSDTDMNPPAALVACSNACTLYLSGACHLTLLQGHVVINGHKLSTGLRTEVNCPCWTPAYHVMISPSLIKHTESLNNIKKSKKSRKQKSFHWINSFTEKYAHVSKYASAFMALGDFPFSSNEAICLILVEAMDIDHCEEWMLKGEDYSKYKLSFNNISVKAGERKGGMWQSADRLHLSSLLLGSADALAQCCVDHCIIPDDWVESADKVCKDIKSCPRTVICGAKGVGKSTYLRYVLNRIMSKNSGKCVALLDCDLGQSEFNVSGLISLHIISSPVLSPSHLRLRKPELSFFIGDITVKSSPALFEEALLQLHARYKSLREQFVLTGDVKGLSCCGPAVDHDDNPCSTYKSGFSALDDTPFSKFSLPLVVNTDGWIKSMGLEVLTNIIATTQPTHVIHLCTDRNKDLPALYQLGVKPFTPCNINDQSDASGSDNLELKAKIFTLKPVQNTASKIAAIDLRNLRLVAYFLRNSSFLNELSYSPIAQSELMQTPSYASKVVNIRNGAIVDPYGLVALAFRWHNHDQELPFQECTLRIIGPAIAPRLYLAAFNLSLVGFTTTLGGAQQSQLTTIRIPDFVSEMLTCTSSEQSSSVDIEPSNFQLRCCVGDNNMSAPCDGIGLVCAVDVLRQNLRIISPEPLTISSLRLQRDMNLSSQTMKERVCLVRGNMQIPTSLMYCLSDPVDTPYLCSENYGEGSSTVSGVRTNLKRRGHQA